MSKLSSALATLLLATACLGTPTDTPIPTPSSAATISPSSSTPSPTDTPPPTVPPTMPPTIPQPSATPAPTQPPTPATNNPLLRASLAAMSMVRSYHYTDTFSVVDNGHQFDSVGEGDYVQPGGLFWSSAVDGIRTTAVLTGEQYYVSVGNTAWTSLPGGGVERARQTVWTVLRQARNVVEVGRDPPTDPDPTIQLTFTLPLNILPLETHPWTLAEGEVWIGAGDLRIRAFKLFAQEPLYETTERFFFSKFNAAPVQITVPPPTRQPEPTATDGREMERDAYLHFD